MKLSYSTLGCPEWSWGDILATAHDFGYDGVEIRGVERHIFAPDAPEFQPAALPRAKAQLKRFGLSIPVLATDSMLHIKPYQDRTIADVAKYVRLAAELGTPYLRVLADIPNPAPGAPVDEGLVRETAKALGDIAEPFGVTVLIETNGWFADTRRLGRLLDAIGHKRVAALWDVHHPARFLGETPEQTVGNLGPHIRHTHFKDSVMADRVRYTLLGEGDLPIEGFVRALQGIGYDGYYSLEWLRRWDPSLEDPGVAFRHYIQQMRKFETA